MAIHKYLKELWKKPSNELSVKTREWRKGPTISRVLKPTRLDRAHALGYRAKQGFVVARIKIKKGGRRRQKIKKGRKPSKSGLRKFTPSLSHKAIGERRVSKKYPNMEVMNSYYVGEDGQFKYYEVILVDGNHPSVKKEKNASKLAKRKGRAHRSLTSSSRRK